VGGGGAAVRWAAIILAGYALACAILLWPIVGGISVAVVLAWVALEFFA
jgi:hypothetical protein